MKISKKDKIGEIVRKHPETVSVCQEYGLGCLGCPAGAMETIEAAAKVHDLDVDSFIEDLNEAIKEK